MKYTLASLARWMPMPASVAAFLYDIYPRLRRQLLLNSAIPDEAWAQIDPKTVPGSDLADILEQRDAVSLCSRVCASTDRRAAVIESIVSGWVLPVELQRQLVAHRIPGTAAGAVLASSFEDEHKLQVAAFADKGTIADWLITNPTIDDDAYLNLATDAELSGLDGELVLAQRPQLARRVAAGGGGPLLSAAARVLTGQDLERFVLWVVEQDGGGRRDLGHLLYLLLERFDVPRRLAGVLARHRMEHHPNWRAAIADLVPVDDPRRSATPLNELDRTTAAELARHLSDMAVTRPSGRSIQWQLAVLVLRGDLPDEVAAQAMQHIPHRMFESALFDHWYDTHRDTSLCDPTSPVGMVNLGRLYDLRRRAVRRERLQNGRTRARTVTVPERTQHAEDARMGPDNATIAAHEATMQHLGDTNMRPRTGVSVTDVSRLLVEKLGDGGDSRSRLAWQTACRLIEVAPDERTLAEVLLAVDVITTT